MHGASHGVPWWKRSCQRPSNHDQMELRWASSLLPDGSGTLLSYVTSQFPGLQTVQVRMDRRSVGDEAVGPAMDLAGAVEFKKIRRNVFLLEGGIVAGSFMPQGMFQREEFRFAHGVVHG